MLLFDALAVRPFLVVCDGDAPDLSGGTDPSQPPAPPAKTFTQEEVNAMLAKERRGLEKKLAEMEAQVQSMMTAPGLTDEQKAEMEAIKESLQRQLQTKDEQVKIAVQKVKTELETKLSVAQKEAEEANRRYREHVIQTELMQAAATAEAYSPSQVVKLYRDRVKEVDGRLIVEFEDVAADGKPMLSAMAPAEAFRRLKELNGTANLFRSNVVAGVGGTASDPSFRDKPVDIGALSYEQYVKLRNENPKALGFNGSPQVGR